LLALLFAGGASANEPVWETVALIDDPYFRFANDIEIDGDRIYILENLEHRVAIGRFDGGKVRIDRMLRGGEGPGELYLPTQLGVAGGRLVIKDERGFSVFDRDGEFIQRFKTFAGGTHFAVDDSGIYFLGANVFSQHIVQRFGFEGESRGGFIAPIAPISEDLPFRTRNHFASYFNGGAVFAREGSLIYINGMFGFAKRIEIDSGLTLAEEELAESLAPTGLAAREKNRDRLQNQADQAGRSFAIIDVFSDAVYTDGVIYLLRLKQYGDLLEVAYDRDEREIVTVDPIDLTVTKRIPLRMSDGLPVSFAIRIADGKTWVYAFRETASDIALMRFALEDLDG
jgi:hypothetical protein